MTLRETVSFLKDSDNFIILTHRRPDGDTIGSSAVLCMGLRQLGKTAHILKNPEITPKYTHLHKGLTKANVDEGDFVVSVDVASGNMLPECFAPLKERIQLRIDHHGTATSFTPWELVEPDAAAYVAIKERAAGIELEAHQRAQGIVNQANAQAEQVRQQATLENNAYQLASIAFQNMGNIEDLRGQYF